MKTHPPSVIEGVVVGGRFEPSVLGSGDHYYLTLESCHDPSNKEVPYRFCRDNDTVPRVHKTLRFSWPEATRMLEQADFPLRGERWKIKITNPYVSPDEPQLSIPALAEVITREKLNVRMAL
jgi:hypothetical protein